MHRHPNKKGGPEAPSSDCFWGRDSPKWGLTGKKCYGSTAVSKSAGDGSTPSFPANLTDEIRRRTRRDLNRGDGNRGEAARVYAGTLACCEAEASSKGRPETG